MNIKLILNPELEEPEVVIHARTMTPEIESLLAVLQQPLTLSVKDADNQWTLIQPAEVFRIWCDDKQVYLRTADQTYRSPESLTRLEQKLQGHRFLRISKSELINFDQIHTFDLSMNGTILVRLKNKDCSYVSRRNVSRIKALLKGEPL